MSAYVCVYMCTCVLRGDCVHGHVAFTYDFFFKLTGCLRLDRGGGLDRGTSSDRDLSILKSWINSSCRAVFLPRYTFNFDLDEYVAIFRATILSKFCHLLAHTMYAVTIALCVYVLATKAILPMVIWHSTDLSLVHRFSHMLRVALIYN